MNCTHLPKDNCPSCGDRLDCATDARGTGASPEPGDVSICMSCGEPLVFSSDLKLRVASTEDLAPLSNEARLTLERAQTLIRAQRLGIFLVG